VNSEGKKKTKLKEITEQRECMTAQLGKEKKSGTKQNKVKRGSECIKKKIARASKRRSKRARDRPFGAVGGEVSVEGEPNAGIWNPLEVGKKKAISSRLWGGNRSELCVC